MDILQAKTIVVLTSLVLVTALEFFFPYYQERKHKLRHDTKNLLIGLLNSLILALFWSSSVLAISELAATYGFGILNFFQLGGWEYPLAILLFDFWMYNWHIVNHKLPLLWRFHRMHHTDRAMDASSALRFHPGEILISGIIRLPIIFLFGLTLDHILVYELILLPVIILHHSNLNLPKKVDTVYKLVFVSPRMHWVHHSDIQQETDSNYSSVFSFWDRIFNTYKIRRNTKEITQGIKEFENTEWHTMKGMLKTPLK